MSDVPILVDSKLVIQSSIEYGYNTETSQDGYFKSIVYPIVKADNVFVTKDVSLLDFLSEIESATGSSNTICWDAQDVFEFTNSTDTVQLTESPLVGTTELDLLVTIGGVIQTPTISYSLNGKIITFSESIPLNTPIVVRYIKSR